jgi:hypothetical protein
MICEDLAIMRDRSSVDRFESSERETHIGQMRAASGGGLRIREIQYYMRGVNEAFDAQWEASDLFTRIPGISNRGTTLFRPCKRLRQGAELLAVSLGEKFVGACGLIILLTGTMIALRFIIA